MRLRDLNSDLKLRDLEVEQVNVPPGFVDLLLGPDTNDSWELWHTLRKSRRNIISLIVSRENGITAESHTSSKYVADIRIKSGQNGDSEAATLLYGPELEAKRIWGTIDREAKTIKVDMRDGYVTYPK